MKISFVKSNPIKDPVYGPQETYNIKFSTKKVGEIHEFTSPISWDNYFRWVVYNKQGVPLYKGFFLDECKLFVEKFSGKFND